MSLREYIVSDENIYHSIYAMESFVFEKTLLDDEDREQYFRLEDKFDKGFIEPYIERCKKRLEEILGSKTLFPVQVYFKPKSYDGKDGSISFRPLHTASLMDQICMACLLNPLMFEQKEEGRVYSEIAKLIPHHFYGNIPSTRLETFFEHWPSKYKQYDERVEEKCKEYIDSHEYETEICLDIQDFFPSIPLAFIFEWVYKKLSLVYSSEEDQETLAVLLIKLLHFNLEIKPAWSEIYYKGRLAAQDEPETCFMNRGITQGLPQGLFFGNLCMIEVAKLIDEIFSGDAYYYVDDSVIFSKESFSDESFRERTRNLNEKLDSYFSKYAVTELYDKYIKLYLDKKFYNFLKRIKYQISVHDDKKSFYCPLTEAVNNSSFINVLHLGRQVSLAGSLSDHLEEVDDIQSWDKINKLIEYIERIIEENERKPNDSLQNRLKFLRRYKKYFLYRKLVLGLRTSAVTYKEDVDNFISTYALESYDLEKFFSRLDEDIFRAGYRLLASEDEDGQKVLESVIELHKRILRHCNLSVNLLEDIYFVQDIRNNAKFQKLRDLCYKSLTYFAFRYYRLHLGQPKGKSLSVLKDCVDTQNFAFLPEFAAMDYVKRHSDELKRKIYNTLFSVLLDINVDDSLTFHSKSSIRLRFQDVRIVCYLRNRHFKSAEFRKFLRDLEQDTLLKNLNNLPADNLLQSVSGIFIRHVKDPIKVDQLLVTHSIVKGLWMNGSKYLYAYTLHNEEHAVELIRLCIRILHTVDYFSLKQDDYLILFLACYLHDISMVVQPSLDSFCNGGIKTDVLATEQQIAILSKVHDASLLQWKEWMKDSFDKVYTYFENSIRSKHPHESAAFIKAHADSFFAHLSNSVLQTVADVSESHGWDAVEVYGRRSSAKKDLFSTKYMMILIRLADLLDMSKDRVNYFLLKQNMRNLSAISRFHWISHYITNRVELTVKYEIRNPQEDGKPPIQETVYVNIYLNTMYDVPVDAWDKCHWKSELIKEVDPNARYEFERYPRISSEYVEEGNCCPNCMLMCKWVKAKNEWLYSELSALSQYINTVNKSLFSTEIKVNIVFENQGRIDQDLYDDAYKYVEKLRP